LLTLNHTANFSGQLGSSPNVNPRFSTHGFSPNAVFTGSFVYDDNLIPSPGSGFVNVFFSSFPDIVQFASTTAFDLSIGGLTFGIGDAQTQFGMQEAGILKALVREPTNEEIPGRG
jgi:hypothetical protein